MDEWGALIPTDVSRLWPTVPIGAVVLLVAIVVIFVFLLILVSGNPKRRGSHHDLQITFKEIPPQSSIPQNNATFFDRRRIQNSIQPTLTLSSSSMVSIWPSPPPPENLKKSFLISKPSLDIQDQFLKVVERMNQSEDLKSLATDLNVIDYRCKETLEQIPSNIIPSLPEISKESETNNPPLQEGHRRKKMLLEIPIPQPKSLMTLTSRTKISHPFMSSWCFADLQESTKNIFQKELLLGEENFINLDYYINELRRVRSAGDQKKIPFLKEGRFYFEENSSNNSNLPKISPRTQQVDSMEQSTMTTNPILRSSEPMTYRPSERINLKNFSAYDDTEGSFRSRLKGSPHYNLPRRRVSSHLYYVHQHPISYSNLLCGPQKADLNQMTEEINGSHKKFLKYLKQEFDSKETRILNEINEICLDEERGECSHVLLSRREALKKQLVRIRVRKEASMLKETKKLQRLNNHIKKCFGLFINELGETTQINKADPLEVAFKTTKKETCLTPSADYFKNIEKSTTLLFKEAWKEIQNTLKESRKCIKKTPEKKRSTRMIAFRKDYAKSIEKNRPQSNSSQWTTETEENVCDLRHVSGGLDLTKNTQIPLNVFPLTPLPSERSDENTFRPTSTSDGDLDKKEYVEIQPELLVSFKPRCISQENTLQEPNDNITLKKNNITSNNNNISIKDNNIALYDNNNIITEEQDIALEENNTTKEDKEIKEKLQKNVTFIENFEDTIEESIYTLETHTDTKTENEEEASPYSANSQPDDHRLKVTLIQSLASKSIFLQQSNPFQLIEIDSVMNNAKNNEIDDLAKEKKLTRKIKPRTKRRTSEECRSQKEKSLSPIKRGENILYFQNENINNFKISHTSMSPQRKCRSFENHEIKKFKKSISFESSPRSKKSLSSTKISQGRVITLDPIAKYSPKRVRKSYTSSLSPNDTTLKNKIALKDYKDISSDNNEDERKKDSRSLIRKRESLSLEKKRSMSNKRNCSSKEMKRSCSNKRDSSSKEMKRSSSNKRDSSSKEMSRLSSNKRDSSKEMKSSSSYQFNKISLKENKLNLKVDRLQQKMKKFSLSRMKSRSPSVGKKSSAVRLLNELSNMISSQHLNAMSVKKTLKNNQARHSKKLTDKNHKKNLNPYTGDPSYYPKLEPPRWKI